MPNFTTRLCTQTAMIYRFVGHLVFQYAQTLGALVDEHQGTALRGYFYNMAKTYLLNFVCTKKLDLLVTDGGRNGRPVMLVEQNKRSIFSRLAST